jgi:ribosomal-protein-alanine N-acetyltransferase
MLHPHTLSELVLRKAVPGDAHAIGQIERASFLHAGERFGDRRVQYLIRSPRAMVVVAEGTEGVLGWIAGFAWLRGREPWGRVYALAVHPDAQGRKLGALLLQQMIDALHKAGAGRTFLEVRPDNYAAIRLYEKAGFVTCQQLPNYYGPGRPAQRMARPR